MSTHNATIKGLSIRRQIMLGFILLIGMSIAITALNIYHLRDFNALFTEHRQASANTNSMLEVDANIAELQRRILSFSYAHRIGDINNILALHSKILSQIAELITQHQNLSASNKKLLSQLEMLISSLKEKIESLRDQREYREKVIATVLAESFDSTDNNLHQLYDSLNHIDNRIIHALWMAQHHLATIQTSSAQYFNTHENKDKRNIQKTFLLLKSNFKEIRTSLSNKDQIKKLDDALISLTEAEQNFHTAVQADRNYLFLLNIVIAGETAEIANSSDELKKEFLQVSQQVNELVEKQSIVNERLAISASIIGSILAILMAFFLGKKISEPLMAITNTFGRLANEENVESIPCTERTDEIGRLANAANVFRETNKRTQGLLERTENFASALKQREIALEHAVAKAQDASLAKSQFLANMSHELRTPMNAVLGMLALLKKTRLTLRQNDYVNKSESAARTLLSLLNDILDLSKAEAGKIELDPIPFRISKTLDDLKTILSPIAAAKDIQLTISLDPRLPQIFIGDELRLKQILINLGSNAIKFTQEGQVNLSIEFSASDQDKTTLTFGVRDTGIGIAAENVVKIFTGFTQAESSTTRRFGGTGLGLAISQHLVALMGGKLEVDSAPGKGSYFYFSLELPKLNEDEFQDLGGSDGMASVADNVQHLHGMKILLVEDNLTNQQIAQELLEYEGAQITTANNGQEALDALTRQRPPADHFDVVLMDLQMPVMDGFSATHAIRNQLGLTQLPIIAMTANAMTSDREACLAAGMNDHVGKPFNLSHLIAVLGKHTNKLTNHINTPIEPVPQAPAPQTETTSTNTPQETPQLLDIDSALSRLGGNKTIFLRMLPKFIQNLESLPESLAAELAKGNYSALAQSLHTLKGTSSTFGFMLVSSTASTAEKELKAGVTGDAASALIQQVSAAIAQSLAASRTIEDILGNA